MTILGQVSTGPLPNYSVIAQAIRDNAGVPSTETVGPRFALSSLGASGTLVAQNQLAIANEAAAISAKDSGGGQSASDPYIIENRDFDRGDSQAFGFLWQDTTAFTYHIKLKNCAFSGDFTTASIRTNCTNAGHTGTLEFENCTFSGAALHFFGLVFNDDITFDRCLFTAVAGGFISCTTFTGDLTITDCYANDAAGAWTGIAYLLQDNSTAGTYTVQYTTVDTSTNNSADYGVRPIKGNSVTLLNSYFKGIDSPIGTGAATTAGPLVITYCRFEDSIEEHILMNLADNHDITYCDFLDNAAGKRGVYYNDSGTNIDDVLVYRCKFTKTSGTGIATDECCESFQAANVIFQECWVTTCPEDAFEHVGPRTGCQIIDCVGDNVGSAGPGQIADIFNTDASDPEDCIVSGIYGDCTDVGAVVTNSNGVTVQNVHVSTPANAVELQTDSDNCIVVGPIANGGAGGLFGTASYTGTGSTIGGVIGVDSIS